MDLQLNNNFTPITRQFYHQDVLSVAQQLIGKLIVHQVNDDRFVAKIVETEAYNGIHDSACHAHKGMTKRTEIMFGEAGFVYVYLIYGMYNMLNIVCADKGQACAVLIRAVEPIQGMDRMRENRQQSGFNISNGPGKLCQALQIDRELNGWDLCQNNKLWLCSGQQSADMIISTGPRVGIAYASQQDQLAAYRFWLEGNGYVSK